MAIAPPPGVCTRNAHGKLVEISREIQPVLPVCTGAAATSVIYCSLMELDLKKLTTRILPTMSTHIPDSPTVSYWEASPDFRALCRRKLSADAYEWAEPQLAAMGERAAKEVASLAAIADREGPRLVTHDARGERINRVEYHPA